MGLSNQKRNILSFWIFGITNNFGYVVMLSAAFDLIKDDNPDPTPEGDCQKMSTGVILLADILPCLVLKLMAPLFAHRIHYNVKVVLCAVFSLISFILVASFHSFSLKVLGVIFASMSSGFGEVTFLALTAHFDKVVVSAWSSGTGFAGVLGATVYLALTLVLSPALSIYIMLVIPVIEIIVYFLLLVRPATLNESRAGGGFKPLIEEPEEGQGQASEDSPIKSYGRAEIAADFNGSYSGLRGLLYAFKDLWYFIVCLFTVYCSEYLINQGLYEIIYFKNASISHSVQYRWYQVLYQIGVFISRSSVTLFTVKHIHIFPILQFLNFWAFFLFGWALNIMTPQLVNLILFALEAQYKFVPSIWIVFAFVLWEGLLGGGCYVNAFYRLYQEVEPRKREFSLGLVSVSDSAGIVLAGLLAIPVHNYICFGHG